MEKDKKNKLKLLLLGGSAILGALLVVYKLLLPDNTEPLEEE